MLKWLGSIEQISEGASAVKRTIYKHKDLISLFVYKKEKFSSKKVYLRYALNITVIFFSSQFYAVWSTANSVGIYEYLCLVPREVWRGHQILGGGGTQHGWTRHTTEIIDSCKLSCGCKELSLSPIQALNTFMTNINFCSKRFGLTQYFTIMSFALIPYGTWLLIEGWNLYST